MPTSFIDYQGKKILFIDYSGLKKKEEMWRKRLCCRHAIVRLLYRQRLAKDTARQKQKQDNSRREHMLVSAPGGLE